MQLTDIFDMGGYGLYVWPAYCITLLIFGLNLFLTLKEKHRVKKIIVQYLQQNSVKRYEP